MTYGRASDDERMPGGLTVTDLVVTYPGKPPVEAVRGVSLRVGPGETVALLGPSGCGKSSLLGAVVGIVEPTSGTVAWNDQDLTWTPVHRRRFGLVFQDGQLFPHLDVARNIGFGPRMAGVSAEARAARVTELLEIVGLEGLGGRAVSELSGGQRQRVALARSLAARPRLLALDEPLSSLDADLRTRLAKDVRDILRSQGVSALLVTHDPAEAEAMAHRVLRMGDGRLL
ncbi:ABC transporter ATP-binding protein [Demequina zhanjiangensis]|uniref:ABC transporter ATP-binding protein n=1 Tax=Demequina zhanjiangensis TaxID=3051659 RepID=A0ABT8G4I1_9MICO|nr:ABC transporter ATP-binding protein [Demequina sp. SYSU T00b26]MDN4474047.1 ABC transporter ATP-binding protein [Demequina sp. SYSU T00b26]